MSTHNLFSWRTLEQILNRLVYLEWLKMSDNVSATLADKMCETSENDIENHMCCILNTLSEQKFIIDFSDI